MAMLSTQEAAEKLGVDDSTLRDWRMQHTGPAYTKLTARCFRYDERDLDAWVKARRYDPSARVSLERQAHAAR